MACGRRFGGERKGDSERPGGLDVARKRASFLFFKNAVPKEMKQEKQRLGPDSLIFCLRRQSEVTVKRAVTEAEATLAFPAEAKIPTTPTAFALPRAFMEGKLLQKSPVFGGLGKGRRESQTNGLIGRWRGFGIETWLAPEMEQKKEAKDAKDVKGAAAAEGVA